jgi:tRNA (cmo5U34)-methyltransferase
MAGLDFDGDYGRQYAATIRQSVPGYDTLLELGAAALAAACPNASSALVVGPGPGEELEGLLQAMPLAQLTVVEPRQPATAVHGSPSPWSTAQPWRAISLLP